MDRTSLFICILFGLMVTFLLIRYSISVYRRVTEPDSSENQKKEPLIINEMSKN